MSITTTSPQWKGRILEGWNPEGAEHWGSQIVQRALAITTFSLILGLAIWFLPSAIAPKLNDLSFELSETQLYWLTSIPGLSCAALRMVYMFLPVITDTRKMVYWSSLPYILPMIGWFLAVQNPNTSFAFLLLLSFTCGVGATIFFDYMPSTSFFLPKRLQGTALSLQESLGNLGISVTQLSAPFLMSMSLFGITWIALKAAASPPVVVNAITFFIPWSLLTVLLVSLLLKDVPIKANVKEQLDIFDNPNTWCMTILYIMTFSFFSGFGVQTALIINSSFDKLSPLAESFNPDTLPIGLSHAFLGTLIDAVLRFA